MKILVLTGCDAAMDSVGNLTAPNHHFYAQLHGYAFERVRDYEPGSHPSWQKMRLIQERLPNYDAILWLDADTIVTNPKRPVTKLIDGHAGLIVSKDWTNPLPEDEIKHFSLGNFVFTNNAQSFILLNLAMARTEWANQPLWEQQAIQEEYRANPEVRPWVKILPRRVLNSVPATPTTTGDEPWEPGDFLCHFTYLPNEERVRHIPRAVVEGFKALTRIPPWWEPVMSMDARHIAMLRAISLIGGWEAALEIGVWKGGSSVAWTDALRTGRLKSYTACDVGFQPEFHAACPMVEDRPARLMEMTGEEALAGPDYWDLIFVDGDHSLETGKAETPHLIRRQPKCLIAHDTRAAEAGFANCEGPAYLREQLVADGWRIFEDAIDRPGEKTHRGFLAATKDANVASHLERIFSLYSY
jgi:hypothetical protein